MTFYHLRTWVELSAIVAMLVAWWLIPPPRPRSFAMASVVAGVALPLELFGYWTTLGQMSNALVYNIFTYVEFLLVLALVHRQGKRYGSKVRVAAVLGTAAMAWDCLIVDPRSDLLIEGIMSMALLLSFLLSYVLWNLARSSMRPLNKVPQFWLFMGMLVFFGGLPPVVAMARYVYAQDRELVKMLWTIVPLLCTVRYGLGAFAFLQISKEPRTAHGRH